MKGLPKRDQDESKTHTRDITPIPLHGQDSLTLVTLLLVGVLLITACHYTLDEVYTFYGLVLAFHTAIKRNNGR
jgi:hypothetical protein